MQRGPEQAAGGQALRGGTRLQHLLGATLQRLPLPSTRLQMTMPGPLDTRPRRREEGEGEEGRGISVVRQGGGSEEG